MRYASAAAAAVVIIEKVHYMRRQASKYHTSEALKMDVDCQL